MFSNLGKAPPKFDAPYPAWADDEIEVIEEAIHCAWAIMLETTDGLNALNTGTEVEITNNLQDALEIVLNESRVARFSPTIFCPPIRGQELEDHTGVFLEKRPDLSFQRYGLVPATRHYALFFECKVVGRGRSFKSYVEDGVERFCDGKYAWGMQHAGMLGYVHSEFPEPEFKNSAIKNWPNPSTSVSITPITSLTNKHGTVGLSEHSRNFVLRNGSTPGNIRLRHLWLTTTK